MEHQPAAVDLCISYAASDRTWAEWVARQLERAGYTTVLQAWEVPASDDLVVRRRELLTSTVRILVLVSRASLAAPYRAAAWIGGFLEDADARDRFLLVRIDDCDLPGRLGPWMLVDLAGTDSPTARARLLRAVRSGRTSPRPPSGTPAADRAVRRTLRRPSPPAAPEAARPAPQPGARYTNLRFMSADGRPVDRTAALGPGGAYRLIVNIGTLAPDTIVEHAAATPFPAEHLPQTPDGNWLAVVAVSDEIEVSPERRWLFLPRAGASWVCGCRPEGGHHCREAERASALAIAVRMPPRVQVAGLRLCIYYQRNLVQSHRLAVGIGVGGVGQSARVDYSLTADLGELGFLRPRSLSILTNANPDGSHRIVVNGERRQPLVFHLTEGQMRDAVREARAALRRIHLNQRAGLFGREPQWHNRYNERNAKSTPDFVDDLRQLAPLGRLLWTALLADQPDQRAVLREELLTRPSVIQVARSSGSVFVFPWALVYDIALESDSRRHRLCRLVEGWDDAAASLPEWPADCPHRVEHGPNTICPYGFWGVRHVIEQPPSMPAGRSLPTLIPLTRDRLQLVIGRSAALDSQLAGRHLASIERLGGFAIADCQRLDEFRDALGAADVQLVYLYCHGRRERLAGSDAVLPYLEFAPDERLFPVDLIAWSDGWWGRNHWQVVSPLVLVNGCHTAELSPESLVNFVDAFVGVHAAGVVGTEVTVHQQVAGEAAELLLERLEHQATVAEALQHARLSLLRKGNLMGLAYTAFCSADLVVGSRRPPARAGG
jgi:TIR domain